MRYIMFSRVSTSDQHVENQTKEMHAYLNSVKKDGDKIFEFEEPDTTSRIAVKNRKVLQEMLSFLRRGDTLIVYKLDRLARKGRELVDMYDDLKNQGVTVYSIEEPTADEELVLIYAFIAMKERANIRARTISGLNRKKSDMERVGSTWYGYKLDETKVSTYLKSRSNGKPYLLIPDKKESEQVELMVKWHEEGCSYGEISRLLTEGGYTNRKGNAIDRSTISRVLKRMELCKK